MTELEKYAQQHSTPENDLLAELDRQTNLRVLKPRMLSGHMQGLLLRMMTRMISPERVLEIGTFTGYSALCFAEGVADGGEVHTIEIDDELEDITVEFISRSEYRDRIFRYVGDALKIAPEIGGRFDLVFIDGDKREYTQYYNMLFDNDLVGSGSWIFADNILWSGKVIEPVRHNDRHTQCILEFNDLVLCDDRVENVIISLRDGISIIRVR